MRRRRSERRIISADPKYKSMLVAKFINMMMLGGKKSTSETIVYTALALASEKIGKPPLEVFEKAINNIKPAVEVKSRRVGGATYQVPVEVRQDRATTLALRWLRNFARQKAGAPMSERMAGELIAAYKGEGSAIKKKEDTHKMAEANKAFAHYRW